MNRTLTFLSVQLVELQHALCPWKATLIMWNVLHYTRSTATVSCWTLNHWTAHALSAGLDMDYKRVDFKLQEGAGVVYSLLALAPHCQLAEEMYLKSWYHKQLTISCHLKYRNPRMPLIDSEMMFLIGWQDMGLLGHHQQWTVGLRLSRRPMVRPVSTWKVQGRGCWDPRYIIHVNSGMVLVGQLWHCCS